MSSACRKIVFIGDSLTEYYDWQGRFPEHRVRNLGVAGETVDGLRRRLGTVFTEITEACLIFIMTGINNIAMEDYEIFGDYRKVLSEIGSRAGGSIVVESILPVALPWLDNGIIRGVNSTLEKVAAEFGADYLDIYGCFVDRNGLPVSRYLLDDGVHLSTEGYKVWADTVADFIGAD